MHLVFTCPKSLPIKSILIQLDKQNIGYEIVADADQIQLWVVEEKFVQPVSKFYEQYLNQYQNRLSIGNLKDTPITAAVLIITFIVAIITQLGQQWVDWFLIAKIQYYPRSWFFYDGAINIWRFVSPIFLHFGIEHLIFNSLSFWYLGSILERNTGRLFFFGLIVVLASISNVSQLMSDGPLFGGLSGVVYGFIGFVFLYQKFIKDLSIPKGLPIFAVVWMLVGMTDILASIGFGNMANTAHFSGLLAGLATFAVYNIMINKESIHEPR